MLFLKSWLQEYIDLSGLTDNEIREVITKKSSEVEEVRYVTDYFGGKVVVGQVKNLRKHSDADRLRIFDADLGDLGTAQIVTAAPNIEEEMIVPIAIVGASLPDFVIAERKMRGEVSSGMVCGKSELLLETGHSAGVWDLEQDFLQVSKTPVLGQSICEALPEFFPKEVLFDVKVLPNRVGVFGSYMGMALELAMILGDYQLLKEPAIKLLDSQEVHREVMQKMNEIGQKRIEVKDKIGITNKFSLFELNMDEQYHIDKEYKKRMYLTGINIIGGLTDVSNYLLFDIGQPNHFFSKTKLDNLNTSSLVIDRIDTPEQFKGLGQLKNKNLPALSNVIKNNEGKTLGIPGISGGLDSAMDVEETSAIIEIANFDPQAIARSSFALKYRSDGSKVWAGGVNSNLILVCLLRIIEIFGLDNLTAVGYWDKDKGNVDSIEELFEAVVGNVIDVEISDIVKNLDSQGESYWDNVVRSRLNVIGQYSDGQLRCEPFYSNLVSKEDVFEEVVRLIGFDDLVPEPIVSYSDKEISKNYKSMTQLKNIWVNYGFDEVVLRPFVGIDKLFEPEKKLELVKAYRTDEPFLRDSLLSSLAISISSNLKKGEKNPRIFEANKVHLHQGGSIVDKVFVDGVMVENDPYAATSLVYTLLNSLKGSAVEINPISLDDAQIGQGYLYQKGDVEIKLIQISNKFKKKYDISLSKSLWWISIDLTAWDYIIDLSNDYTDESDYPGISRSYSFSIDKGIKFEDIQSAINSLSIADVEFFLKPVERFSSDDSDVVNIEIDYESQIRTIDSKEVEVFEDEILAELSKLGDVKRR